MKVGMGTASCVGLAGPDVRLARIDTIHVAAAITNTRVIVGERANRRRSAEVPNGMAVRVQVRGSSASLPKCNA